MNLAVKICGLSTPEAVDTATQHGATYAGFVCYPPSPRHVEPEQAAILRQCLPQTVSAVAVCVDPEDALLERLVSVIRPDFLQLHGLESPERCAAIRVRYNIPIIKALGIAGPDDLTDAQTFADCADMLLLDAKPTPGGMPGGTGRSYDWSLLQDTPLPLPWFLSGGLNAENLSTAVQASGAEWVDASSSLESAPGIKDLKKIEQFLNIAKEL